MRSVDRAIVEDIVESMRKGTQGEKPNNAAYGFTLPKNPFENVGKPGYEAQDRELFALMESVEAERPDEDPDPAD